METAIIVVFVLGYLAIAFEHTLKIDKLVPALVMMALIWAIISFFGLTVYDIDPATKSLVPNKLEKVINYFLGHTAEILIFLIGAMTIVEIIDFFNGFSTIKRLIKTKSKIKILWIICFLAFFLSAIIDNLTATIVLITILQKIISDRNLKLWYAGMIIVAANAGGAWSPIGDVTTIMLWIGGQVTALNIIQSIIIPSLVCFIVPMIYVSFKLKGNINKPDANELIDHKHKLTTKFERNFIFFLGVAGLLFVPIFKTVTHLPPYIGILFSLGIMWFVTEILHRTKNNEKKSQLNVIGVLKKIDIATIFFFLGILLAVASLQSMGHLNDLAIILNETFNGQSPEGIYVINMIIGLLSSIVDNVPLVAGAMGMYPIVESGFYAVDGMFWEFLAYCAGTGGSVLIIGSAAGVAVMGILKIDFIWYMKKISLLAFLGYVSGALCYILLQ